MIARGSAALTGLKLTKNQAIEVDRLIEMYRVLDRAQRDPFKIKSNFARTHAFELAVCASEGFITTFTGEENVYSDQWGLTNSGVSFKENLDGIIDEIIGRKPHDLTH